jgi:hypothetical protein
MKLASIALLLMVLVMISVPAIGLADNSDRIEISNPLGTTSSLPALLTKIFREVRVIVSFIIPLIVIWGAFQMLFAAGNPEKFASGRNTIVYSIIGYVIILAAEGIARIVERVLTT